HTIDAKVQESKTMIDEMAFFIEKSNKTLKHLEDIQAKISLKEHIIQQDTAAAVRHNNNFYTQPSNDYKPQEQLKKPIITSPSTVIYGSKPAVPQPQEAEDKQDSKKLAIESLLEKIAEIQKRSRGNAS
ncbi:MAG: hypothetical protein J0G32_07380, partial [Alphaproteobacteria bacterium]|nr:hypothetical protein [Alphaproteobacteria bacterium]